MENIDIIILTFIAIIAFSIFIITSLKEFNRMTNDDYQYDQKSKKYGRDYVFQLLERLFDDKATSNSEKVILMKTIDRTISDMESDGVYFSDEIKEKLEKEREELFCEYSGLPSPKSYAR